MIYDVERSQIIAGGILTPEEITTGIIPKPEIAAGAQKPTAPLKPPSTGGGGGSKPYKKQYKYMLTKGYNCVRIYLPFTYDKTCSTTVYFNSGLTGKSTEGRIVQLNNNDLASFNGEYNTYTFSPLISNQGYVVGRGNKINTSAEQICYFDLSLSSLKYGVKDVNNYSVSFSLIKTFECTHILLFGDVGNKIHEKTQFMGAVIKQGDEIKYNLIPVQDMDGVDCWFDTVNSEFYYPTGSGEHYFQGIDELIY